MTKQSRRQTLPASAVVLCLAASASAVVSYCPSGAKSLCFGVGIPQSTASTGSGNIYFSISAPTSYQWVALGTGSMMYGSNMFIMYQDGAGNVTLSPRLGTFHTTPSLDTSSKAAKLTLLAGSGVSGNVMTANVMCSNCESWGSSGKLSVASTSSPWIGAWKSGGSLATTNKNAAISQHDDTAQYQFDLTKATISSDSNPFVTASGSNSGSGSGSGSGGGSSSAGSGSGNSGGSSGSGNGGSSSSGGGATVVSSSSKSTILAAHGILMALVMVALYPLGSALMPLLGKWLLHGIWQGLAYLLMWAGFALGVVTAQQRGLLFAYSGQTHTILGTVVVAAMGVQPFLGLVHHRHFVKNQGRGFVSHWHIWWGRLLMVLGIVNGGLGLQLAAASTSVIIAYSVVSAVLFLAYVAAKVIGSCCLTPRREKRNMDRNMSISGNGRRIDDNGRGVSGRSNESEMAALRSDRGYYGGDQYQAPQQERRYQGSQERQAPSYSNNNDSSSAPSVPRTRSDRRPPPPPSKSGYSEQEDLDQDRRRARREERRHAY